VRRQIKTKNTAAELENIEKNRSSTLAGDNDQLSSFLHGLGETLEKKILKCTVKGLDNGKNGYKQDAVRMLAKKS